MAYYLFLCGLAEGIKQVLMVFDPVLFEHEPCQFSIIVATCQGSLNVFRLVSRSHLAVKFLAISIF